MFLNLCRASLNYNKNAMLMLVEIYYSWDLYGYRSSIVSSKLHNYCVFKEGIMIRNCWENHKHLHSLNVCEFILLVPLIKTSSYEETLINRIVLLLCTFNTWNQDTSLISGAWLNSLCMTICFTYIPVAVAVGVSTTTDVVGEIIEENSSVAPGGGGTVVTSGANFWSELLVG